MNAEKNGRYVCLSPVLPPMMQSQLKSMTGVKKVPLEKESLDEKIVSLTNKCQVKLSGWKNFLFNLVEYIKLSLRDSNVFNS